MRGNNGDTGELRREIKVLVVDEHPTMRLGASHAIEAEESMLVVGEAGDAEEALRLVAEARPDVIVMDLALGDEGGGAELLRRLKSLPDAPGAVVHTARNSKEDMFTSRLAGADSFVYKGEEPVRLIEAVKETHSGRRVWFLGEERRELHPPTASDDADDPRLTRREKEVFHILLGRYTNDEIAQELSISLQTTKNHVSSVLRKFGAQSRSGLFLQRRWSRMRPGNGSR